MKKILSVIAVLVLTGNCFSQTSKIIRYLPAATETILVFDPLALANKVPGDVFRQSFMYREIMKENNADLKAFMTDPSVSGIDFSSGLVLAMEGDPSSPFSSGSVNIFGLLKSPELFQNMMKKLAGKESVKTYGSNKILFTEGFGPAIAWNNEIFVFTNGNSRFVQQEMQGFWMPDSANMMAIDTTSVVEVGTTSDEEMTSKSEEEYEKKMEQLKEKIAVMTREYCFQLLTPNDQNPFLSNTHLADLLKKPADIRTWSNGSSFFQSLNKVMPGFGGLFSWLKTVAGNDKISIVNFENGKITGVSHNYVNEKMAALHNKYPPVPQNLDLVKRLPADGKLLALMNVSAHPDMAREMLQLSGLGDFLDSIKKELPFDPALLTSSFGNQVMMAVIRLPQKEKNRDGNEVEVSKFDKVFRDIHFLIAMPIRNKENFEKLYASLSKAIKDLKEKMKKNKEMELEGDDEEEEYTDKRNWMGDVFENLKLSVKYNDSLCVLSFSENIAETFINNPGNGTVPAWLQASSQYPMVFSLDFKELINTVYLSAGSPSEAEDLQAKTMLDNFGTLLVTGGSFSNGSVNSRMEFTLGDPNKNSLLQLFEIMNQLIESTSSRRMQMEDVEIDMPPPPVEELKTVDIIQQEGVKIIEEKREEEVDKVFEKVEIEAAFPGGDKAWRTYLTNTLRAAIPVDNGAPEGQFTVVVQFVVDKNGNISDVKALTNHGYGMEQEVIRVIRVGPKWSPALQGGRQVKAYRKQPVTFVVMSEKKKNKD